MDVPQKLEGPCEWRDVMTLEEIVAHCLQMKPDKAAQENNSDLCVSPLITAVIIDGRLYEMPMTDNKWWALIVRVSSDPQRGRAAHAARELRAQARARKSRSNRRTKQDGYSEQEQLTRGIRHFAIKGQPFKIYSDAGVTGEFPNNKPHLIDRLLKKKADRYRRIYERTLLDEASIAHRTPEEIVSMRVYLSRRVEKIKQGLVSEKELYKSTGEGMDERTKRGLRGRPRQKAFHRQGFTQAWEDAEHNRLHGVCAVDRSRVCRDADLETEWLEMLSLHGVRLVGLVEDMSSIDVSDPLKKGLTYFLASVNESRLQEIAGNAFRGFVQLLESGRPNGRLPWWLERDEDGFAQGIDGLDDLARRIVQIALADFGSQAICSKLRAEGIQVDGAYLTEKQIDYMLDGDAIMGIHNHFGIAWKLFPEIVKPEVVRELRELREARSLATGPLNETVTWANHMFSGILRCYCGKPAARKRGPRDQDGSPRGYYVCSLKHKRVMNEKRHAFLNEAKLQEFIQELVVSNPNLLTGALASSLGAGGARERTARRAMVEERIAEITAEIRCQEEAARKQAEATAQQLGIACTSSRYERFIDEAVQGMLEESTSRLAALRHELTATTAEIAHDRQMARFSEAIAELGDWSSLDVLTRNRLLKSVIEVITIYPWHVGGKLEIKLVGIEQPLPPIYLQHLQGRDFRLPTVEEWIENSFGLCGKADPSVPLWSRTMKPFYSYGRKIGGSGPLGDLGRMIRADKKFPKRSSYKPRIARHLLAHGADEAIMSAFDDAWGEYMTLERQRLSRAQREQQSRSLPDEQSE